MSQPSRERRPPTAVDLGCSVAVALVGFGIACVLVAYAAAIYSAAGL
jgi:hypothetical protein